MKNRSKTLIISMVLGVGYSIYLMSYFYNITICGSGMDFIVGSLASAIVFPHMITTIAGAVFSVIAVITNKRWSVMVSFILYYVASILFIMYAVFTLPIAIISTIGYVRMKKYIEKK